MDGGNLCSTEVLAKSFDLVLWEYTFFCEGVEVNCALMPETARDFHSLKLNILKAAKTKSVE